MTPSPDLWLYFVLVLGIIALPGMDMAYVVASSLASGLRGGVASVGGIVAGGAIHTLVGATGVAALLLVVPQVMQGLMIFGGAYLAWIGLQLLCTKAHGQGDGAAGPADSAAGLSAGHGAGDAPQTSSAAIFRYGVLSCLINPKAYAFMLAVFPGFLHTPVRGLGAQALALGCITAATQIAIYGVAAYAAVHLRQRMGTSPLVQVWMPRAVGAVLLLTAAALVGQSLRG